MLQRAVEIERVDGVDRPRRRRRPVVELHRQLAAAALLPQRLPRMIDDDAPHELRGEREEVAAVLPVDVPLSEQLEVGLVDHDRRLQPIVAPFVLQLPRRQRAQLLVHQRHQLIECVAAAVPPLVEETREMRRVVRVAHVVAAFECMGGPADGQSGELM